MWWDCGTLSVRRNWMVDFWKTLVSEKVKWVHGQMGWLVASMLFKHAVMGMRTTSPK